MLLVLDIPLEDNQLKEAKGIVMEYANSLAQRQPKAMMLRSQNIDDSIVFQRKSPPSPSAASEKPPPKVVEAIDRLWQSSGVQKAYQRRNEFQLVDSAAYFLGNVSTFTTDNYTPSDQDILRTRVTTTGIVKVNCIIKSLACLLHKRTNDKYLSGETLRICLAMPLGNHRILLHSNKCVYLCVQKSCAAISHIL